MCSSFWNPSILLSNQAVIRNHSQQLMKYKLNDRIFINGSSNTIELIIIKIGTKYAILDDPNYRYIIEYDAVQIKKGGKWGGHTKAFISPQDAEYYLEGKMQTFEKIT
jgi:hypothetical protein